MRGNDIGCVTVALICAIALSANCVAGEVASIDLTKAPARIELGRPKPRKPARPSPFRADLNFSPLGRKEKVNLALTGVIPHRPIMGATTSVIAIRMFHP